MSHSIFISRSLSEDSKLLAFLSNEGYQIHASSLIQIEPVPFRIEAAFDWLFLSSSNGVRFLLEAYKPSTTTKFGVVGEATSKALQTFEINPAFIGEGGDMIEVGNQFRQLVGSEQVLFAGAEGGSKKIQDCFPPGQVEFVATYRTKPKGNVDIPNTDIIFLTSPSNCKSFLKNASFRNKTVIAIGNTTAEYLAANDVEKVLIPKSPRDEDVIDLLRGL